MNVKGILCDLINHPIKNGLIQIISTLTSEKVLCGSIAIIKTEQDGSYDFELLPGAYNVYAQPSRCSDIIFSGSVVVTNDTPDGSLNDILGISTPLLPPQVELILSATKEAKLAAKVAKSAAESSLSSAQTATEQSKIATSAAESSSGSAQTATEQAEIATSAAESSSGSAQTATEQAKIATKAAESSSDSAQTATEQAKIATNAAESSSSSAQTATEQAEIATSAAESSSSSAQTATEQAEVATSAAKSSSSSAQTASEQAQIALEIAKELKDILANLALNHVHDYSDKHVDLADTSNVIYSTLPRNVMAIIPSGEMQQINDENDYPLFQPRADIEYVLSIQTYSSEIGFEQTLTIIERTDIKHDVNFTLKRSGRSFVDATQWDSMVGIPMNKEITVDTLLFRNDVRAIDI
ncbi:prophage tail fiber N-terminal domain-containing protein [Photobacterium damselae]|uniref:prophage tail fiber N-terminal domain-containing protein n=1 Tax=Photobacterium damselae TaxID=38293 RepID=UPI004067D6B7